LLPLDQPVVTAPLIPSFCFRSAPIEILTPSLQISTMAPRLSPPYFHLARSCEIPPPPILPFFSPASICPRTPGPPNITMILSDIPLSARFRICGLFFLFRALMISLLQVLDLHKRRVPRKSAAFFFPIRSRRSPQLSVLRVSLPPPSRRSELLAPPHPLLRRPSLTDPSGIHQCSVFFLVVFLLCASTLCPPSICLLFLRFFVLLPDRPSPIPASELKFELQFLPGSPPPLERQFPNSPQHGLLVLFSPERLDTRSRWSFCNPPSTGWMRLTLQRPYFPLCVRQPFFFRFSF